MMKRIFPSKNDTLIKEITVVRGEGRFPRRDKGSQIKPYWECLSKRRDAGPLIGNMEISKAFVMMREYVPGKGL